MKQIINQDYQTNQNMPILALKELVANLQREQNKIQTLLSSLGFALRSFNNLNQFLELTPLMAARVTDADGGALILYKGKKTVSLENFYCHNPQISDKVKKNIQKIIHEVLTSNLKNVDQKDGHLGQKNSCLPLVFEERLKEELNPNIIIFSTPILVKNVERGKIYIFSNNPDYTWTQTRRKLVQLVADQTAVAMANNELTLQLRSKERQDRELEIAEEIQRRLLPRKCPNIKGLELAAKCKTANRVGGDYYDFISVNYDQLNDLSQEDHNPSCEPWSIVIGDVMGKGVPAGLIMTMTRGMLRAEVLNRHSPAQVLQHLNRVMYADLETSHRFVTLFYSEYDPQTKILRYSNAAHNPPILWQATTKTIQRLDTEGMLIGLDLDSVYGEDQIQLAEGDILIYYTDGFTDVVNQSGERFDEDNLYRIFQYACQNYVNCQDILEYFFTQVEKFIGFGHYNSDDMTLVVMRVKSS